MTNLSPQFPSSGRGTTIRSPKSLGNLTVRFPNSMGNLTKYNSTTNCLFPQTVRETVKWQRRTILNSFKMELLPNLSTNSDIIHFLFPRHPALEESNPSTAHIMSRKITIFFTERNILILSKMHSSNLFFKRIFFCINGAIMCE